MSDKRRPEGAILSDTGHNQDLKDDKAERKRVQEVVTTIRPTLQQLQKDDPEARPENQLGKKEVIVEEKVVKKPIPEPDVAESEGSALSSLGQNGAPSPVQANDIQYSGQLADVDPVVGNKNEIYG